MSGTQGGAVYNNQAKQVAEAASQQGVPTITVERYNPKLPTGRLSTADISATVMAVEAQGYELVSAAPSSWRIFRRNQRFRTLR